MTMNLPTHLLKGSPMGTSMNQPKVVSYSFVMADLFHYGHLRLLKQAKENADYHICGVVSDAACHTWQGINICNFEERRAVIDSLDCVDEVVEQKTLNPVDNLKAILARFPGTQLVVVHGNDWKSLPGREFVLSHGGKIIQPEYYAKLSRNNIIKKFQRPENLLDYELLTQHFRIGKIIEFDSERSSLLSTKADTLKAFNGVLNTAHIEKLFAFTVADFQTAPEGVLDSIQAIFHNDLVVRSSALTEDSATEAKAGYFTSILGVPSTDRRRLSMAISTVISSYEKGQYLSPLNQVLVQSQTQNVARSGVVYTRNLETNSPYYQISYNADSSKTDVVTGGGHSQTLWILRTIQDDAVPSSWARLLRAIKEIESHLPGMVLDIEFAEKQDGTIVIYQIRPLAANVRFDEASADRDFLSCLRANTDRYQQQTTCRNRLIFSDMAFWNPSELIGDNPFPLDFSIFRELIALRNWNDGIHRLGYSSLPKNLLERFGNKPYINVNHALYSLTPNHLPESLKLKLVSAYEELLLQDPSAHDKIEFEIVLSCFDFNTTTSMDTLLGSEFSQEEKDLLRTRLKELTTTIVNSHADRIANDFRALSELEDKRKEVCAFLSNDSDASAYLKAFLTLLDATSKLAVQSFCSVAREAFIAKSVMQSLLSTGLFKREEVESFLAGISTVATEFDRDFDACSKKALSVEQFMETYGHLREGTYNIRTKRYDQMEMTFSNNRPSRTSAEKSACRLNEERLQLALNQADWPLDATDLIDFTESAVYNREYVKFVYTKSLSDALEYLATAGGLLGLAREDLSYLDLAHVKSHRFFCNKSELKLFFEQQITVSRQTYDTNSKLILPPMIRNSEDFGIIEYGIARPNFITTQIVTGNAINLEEMTDADIDGKIVALTKADPGYDWIFTRNIKGLVTKYGGAGSHMAIRCAEFGLPAAIGCGETIFTRILRWCTIELNCYEKAIRRKTF